MSYNDYEYKLIQIRKNRAIEVENSICFASKLFGKQVLGYKKFSEDENYIYYELKLLEGFFYELKDVKIKRSSYENSSI